MKPTDLFSVVLHTPGCNDPNELCSPHTGGLNSIFNADIYSLFAFLVVVLVVLAVYLSQRYMPYYGGSNE